jgi:hypothetical protein
VLSPRQEMLVQVKFWLVIWHNSRHEGAFFVGLFSHFILIGGSPGYALQTMLQFVGGRVVAPAFVAVRPLFLDGHKQCCWLLATSWHCSPSIGRSAASGAVYNTPLCSSRYSKSY